jgi:hypothetical protein
MIDTDKYESMRQLFLDFIDSASDEVDEGAWKNKLTMLDDLLAEVKRLQYWDEEMDRVIATLDEHNWASSDGDVHEIVTHLLAEVERLHEIEREWKQLWSKLEDYPDICAELISFMESEEE